MAKVTISNVDVRDNPCSFKKAFQFEITFECADDLADDLEWKLIYVGSAESEQYDQVLDTIAVGPVIAGKHMFVFETNAPNINRIPKSEVVGVTVVLLTCYYRQQEFIRVGYYVNNEYADPELKETPPSEPDFDKLQRNILATCPRVTRFKIDWGGGLNEQLLPHIEDLPSSSSSVAGTSGTSRPEEEDFDEEEEDDELDDDELVSEDDEEDEEDASEVDIGQEDMDEDMMDEDIENSPGTSNAENIPPSSTASSADANCRNVCLEGTQDSLMSLPSLDAKLGTSSVGGGGGVGGAHLAAEGPLVDRSNSMEAEPMQM